MQQSQSSPKASLYDNHPYLILCLTSWLKITADMVMLFCSVTKYNLGQKYHHSQYFGNIGCYVR